MDLSAPDLLDTWLEPPEDVFSTGSFLELGLHCPPPEAPGTRLQEQGLPGWESTGGHDHGLQENEPEDCLKIFIDPNEVYCSEASPGSDSGISEDPGCSDSPPAPQPPSSPALYEVVYEAGILDGMQRTAEPTVGLISIQLDQWSPPLLVPEACMVSRLPLDAHPPILPRAGAVAPGPADTLVSPGIGQSRGSLLLTSRDTLISDPLHMLTEMETRDARLGRAGYLGIAGQRVQGEEKQPLDMKQMISGLCYSEACAVQLTGGLRELSRQPLFLTDEEKRLLGQEGVSLPSHLPLTKAEERVLKKVRRKIRNKQSAQDSRRRKKEYIDGLESRVAACSAQNQELQKKVQELERHNISLVAQLRQLQSLIAQTSTKAAQTSTCVLILLFSLVLIILPSFSPFQGLPQVGPEDYQAHGVISRNILTHKDIADNLETPVAESRLQEPPGAKRVNGSARTLLEKTRGRPGASGRLTAVLHADEM